MAPRGPCSQGGLASSPWFPPDQEARTEGFSVPPKGRRERPGLQRSPNPPLLPASAHRTCFFPTPSVAPSSHCFNSQECPTVGNQRLFPVSCPPSAQGHSRDSSIGCPPPPWMGRAPAAPPVGVDQGTPQGYQGAQCTSPNSPQSPPHQPICLPPSRSYLSLPFPTPSLFLSVFLLLLVTLSLSLSPPASSHPPPFILCLFVRISLCLSGLPSLCLSPSLSPSPLSLSGPSWLPSWLRAHLAASCSSPH